MGSAVFSSIQTVGPCFRSGIRIRCKKILKNISAVGRIDSIMEPSPNGNNISYIPFDPSSKATLFILGTEIPVTSYFLIHPNIIFTTYDTVAGQATPNNDLMFRCTVFLNLE